MTNLLKETREFLEFCIKTTDDVNWVGSNDGKYVISWTEFEKIANFEYDAGYGSQKIAPNLVVVGDNWWISRAEYDGAEDWIFNTLPIMDNSMMKPFDTVMEHIK